MLFCIVSVSAVCLALAINGWVPPDPHASAVTYTGLLTIKQLSKKTRYVVFLSTWRLQEWLDIYRIPFDVITGENPDDFCSCRPGIKRSMHESDRIFVSYSCGTTLMTYLETGLAQMSEGLSNAVDFILTNVHAVISEADYLHVDDTFPMATWRTDTRLHDTHIRDLTTGEILQRDHVFFCLGSWIPVLLVFALVVLRGKKKKINRHYVVSMKEVQRALAKGRRKSSHCVDSYTWLNKPLPKNMNLSRDHSPLQPVFGRGDFNQTFKMANGKLVVEKLKPVVEQPCMV